MPEKHGNLLLVRRGDELRYLVRTARRQGERTGLVPTMGALHEGHLSLVQACLEECDLTAATIFVNPTQFGAQEDLATYPRTLDSDLQQLEQLGVNVVFVPSEAEMYPPGFSTYVEPPAVARRWEGECRPGHFRGVATVVLKLFGVAPVDIAYFGQKDYQQSLVIRRMVRDFQLPTEIRVLPIVREADGLAMSSRNRHLTADERIRATSISRALQQAADQVRGGERNVDKLTEGMRSVMSSAGVDDVDYAALADAETLEPAAVAEPPVVALIAARVGATRLIDNHLIE